MRTLFVLILGGIFGAVAVIAWDAVDPAPQAKGSPGIGEGNAQVSFDETALASIIQRSLATLEGVGADAQVTTEIRADGLIDVHIVVQRFGVGLEGSALVEPRVVDGELRVEVAEARLGRAAVPDELAGRIESPLRQYLADLADRSGYALTGVSTAGGRLTLDARI